MSARGPVVEADYDRFEKRRSTLSLYKEKKELVKKLEDELASIGIPSQSRRFFKSFDDIDRWFIVPRARALTHAARSSLIRKLSAFSRTVSKSISHSSEVRGRGCFQCLSIINARVQLLACLVADILGRCSCWLSQS